MRVFFSCAVIYSDHSHYKDQMDKIQEEAKKQIKEIEGKYMEAFEDRISEVRNHYEDERETIIGKFNEAKELLNNERNETDLLRRKVRTLQQ
jgi:vacuolar-type H+-ATPase subunit H